MRNRGMYLYWLTLKNSKDMDQIKECSAGRKKEEIGC
jgi:hypothetical protein